jgi:hypothetical protein
MVQKILLSILLAAQVLHGETCLAQIADLSKIDTRFDVSGFYGARIARTNEMLRTDPKSLSKEDALNLLTEQMFMVDTLCYYYDKGMGGRYIHDKQHYSNRNKPDSGTFAYDYRTISWSPDGHMAVLNKVHFQRINMLKAAKDSSLAALFVENTSNDPGDCNKTVLYLNGRYGAAITVNGTFSDEHALQWDTGDFLIQLLKKEETVDDILSISVNGTKKTRPRKEVTTSLFFINKAFLPDMQLIRIGSWINIVFPKQ